MTRPPTLPYGALKASSLSFPIPFFAQAVPSAKQPTSEVPVQRRYPICFDPKVPPGFASDAWNPESPRSPPLILTNETPGLLAATPKSRQAGTSLDAMTPSTARQCPQMPRANTTHNPVRRIHTGAARPQIEAAASVRTNCLAVPLLLLDMFPHRPTWPQNTG